MDRADWTLHEGTEDISVAKGHFYSTSHVEIVVQADTEATLRMRYSRESASSGISRSPEEVPAAVRHSVTSVVEKAAQTVALLE